MDKKTETEKAFESIIFMTECRMVSWQLNQTRRSIEKCNVPLLPKYILDKYNIERGSILDEMLGAIVFCHGDEIKEFNVQNQ